MNRRAFITTVGTVAFAGCTELGRSQGTEEQTETETETSETTTEQAPKEVKTVRSLAADYHTAVREHYSDARVFINPDGSELAMSYTTRKETAESLKSELYQLIDLYATVAKNGGYEPISLTVVMDSVEAFAPGPSVKSYVAGDLKQNAFFETIEVMGVEQGSN